MLKTIKSHSKRIIPSITLAFGLLAGAQSAMAENCYIMVHGHGTQGDYKSGTNQPALDYWKESHFSEYQNGNFFDHLIGPNEFN